jgi:hypothetical protein
METSEMQFGKRRLGTNSVLFEYISRPYSRFSAIWQSVFSFHLTQAATWLLVRERRILRLQISSYCTTMITTQPGSLACLFSAFISKHQVKLVYDVRFLTWIRETHTVWMVARISTLGFLLFTFFQAGEGHYLRPPRTFPCHRTWLSSQIMKLQTTSEVDALSLQKLHSVKFRNIKCYKWDFGIHCYIHAKENNT